MLGVVKLHKALEIAESAGLDLVEVSPNAKPPVCKILDHGKFKFEAQKKAAKARKKHGTTGGTAPNVLATDPAMATQTARRSPQTLTKHRQVCLALPAKWRKMEENTIQAQCAPAFAKGSLEYNCLDVP